MYGLKLRSAIAVWLMVSCSDAHPSTMADYRINDGDTGAVQWVWMNASGGEDPTNFTQIISTCTDQNSGSLTTLKRSIAIIFMPKPGTLTWIGVSSLTGEGCLVAYVADVSKEIGLYSLRGKEIRHEKDVFSHRIDKLRRGGAVYGRPDHG